MGHNLDIVWATTKGICCPLGIRKVNMILLSVSTIWHQLGFGWITAENDNGKINKANIISKPGMEILEISE